MEQTASGLIVPNGTMEKTAETFEGYESQALNHCAQVMDRHEAQIAVMCRKCQNLFTPAMDDQGRPTLECNCRVIRLKRPKGMKAGL